MKDEGKNEQVVLSIAAHIDEIREWYRHVFGILPSYEFIDINDISLLRFSLGDGQHDVIIKIGYTEPYELRVRPFWGVKNLQIILSRFKETQLCQIPANESRVIISSRNGESVQGLTLEDPHGYILQLASYSLDNKTVRSCGAC